MYDYTVDVNEIDLDYAQLHPLSNCIFAKYNIPHLQVPIFLIQVSLLVYLLTKLSMLIVIRSRNTINGKYGIFMEDRKIFL